MADLVFTEADEADLLEDFLAYVLYERNLSPQTALEYPCSISAHGPTTRAFAIWGCSGACG